MKSKIVLAVTLVFGIVGIQNIYATSVFLSNCQVKKVQLQRAASINGGVLAGSHHVARINLVQGTTTTYAWFDVDDPLGFGKNLLSVFLTASSTGNTVNVSLDDSRGTFQYVEDGPPSQVTQYIWTVSLN